jgi:hypothetical protein
VAVMRRTPLAWLLLMALYASQVAAADLSPSTRAEIDHLLGYLEDSGCRFERNGKWHDAPEARSHMERKLRWLEKRDLVSTTEQFIERAATESSRSGKPYRVQCESREPVASAAWFTAELERWRATHRDGASN